MRRLHRVDVLARLPTVGLGYPRGSGVQQLALVEVYLSRFGKDPVDGLRLNGVAVSFAKDSSVGFGALKKALKSLSVTFSASALSLDELTTPILSKAAPK